MSEMDYVDEIRAALREAKKPLYKRFFVAQENVRKRAEHGNIDCIRTALTDVLEAYAPLFLAEEDRVRQLYGLPPVEYYMQQKDTTND